MISSVIGDRQYAGVRISIYGVAEDLIASVIPN